MSFSPGFKARMVQRLTGPGRVLVRELAEEVGVGRSTLYEWLEQAKAEKTVKRREKELPPDQRPAAEKLRLVMEAAALSEEELGEFLRRNGVHEAQLKQWRDLVVGVLEKPKKRGKSPEARRIRELERELRRKDKALAEVTALLALKKKLEMFLGDEDDDTQPMSDERSCE